MNQPRNRAHLGVSVLVPGLGFEPRLADPNSAVLPLDDPGTRKVLPFAKLRLQFRFAKAGRLRAALPMVGSGGVEPPTFRMDPPKTDNHRGGQERIRTSDHSDVNREL